MGIIALIPAFNESHTIGEVVLRTKPFVDKVIVYNDGSTDHTVPIAGNCGAIVIDDTQNRGRGYALKRLFDYAYQQEGVDIVVTLDADGQHNPEDIPRLVTPIVNKDAKMTIGIRQNQKFYRRIANGILDKMVGHKETQSGFRAYHHSLLATLSDIIEDGFGADTEIISKMKGVEIKFVPINVKYDEYSHTKNPILHFLELFGYILTNNPLIYLCLPGIVIFIGSIAGLALVSDTWNKVHQLAIGTMLISMTGLLTSIVTFFTGIILHVLRKPYNRGAPLT